MRILEIKSLAIPDIKVIKFARFHDNRGYFTEQFRKSDLFNHPELNSMKNIDFVQGNESYSRKNAIRGLHFQWNPYMGKFVRTLSGHMVDLALDIRKGSPSYGKIIAYDMPASEKREYDEWIWIPPGFAHGFFFPKNSLIEYLCSGEYNHNCESGISPFAEDIGWSLCDNKLTDKFNKPLVYGKELIKERDRDAFSLKDWDNDERSKNFLYDDLKMKGLC
jgi:dTDP-4-dehydrorhamnose 3,5-epimerase